jgi:hypothetical protein
MHNKNNKTTDKLIINMHTTRNNMHTKVVASRAGEASSSCPRAITTTLV